MQRSWSVFLPAEATAKFIGGQPMVGAGAQPPLFGPGVAAPVFPYGIALPGLPTAPGRDIRRRRAVAIPTTTTKATPTTSTSPPFDGHDVERLFMKNGQALARSLAREKRITSSSWWH